MVKSLSATFILVYLAVFLVNRYFRKDNMFGLACFENMPVENRSERGARMKSVGILATSYTLLYGHMQFLEAQVRYLVFSNFLLLLVFTSFSLHITILLAAGFSFITAGYWHIPLSFFSFFLFFSCYFLTYFH